MASSFRQEYPLFSMTPADDKVYATPPSAVQHSRRLISSTSMEHRSSSRSSTRFQINSNATSDAFSYSAHSATPAVVSLAELQRMIGLPPKDIKTPSHHRNHHQSGANKLLRSWFPSLSKRKNTAQEAHSRPIRSANTADDRNVTPEILKQKLMEASIKRDIAVTEAGSLRSSMNVLEGKLKTLEIYCENLKNALKHALEEDEGCCPWSHFSPNTDCNINSIKETFAKCTAEARFSVRQMCRMFVVFLQQDGSGKGLEKLNSLLKPYQAEAVSCNKISRCALYHVEAFFNQALYQNFETANFQKNGCRSILDPFQNCAANFLSFNSVRSLAWEEVVCKGTKFFSESFSRFCDEKMSVIAEMLELNDKWPQRLLESFFEAAKSLWLVHLLAFSFEPPISIFRIAKSTAFHSEYMDDMFAEQQKEQALDPAAVKIMVMPGFYIRNSVIKCKVLCNYQK